MCKIYTQFISETILENLLKFGNRETIHLKQNAIMPQTFLPRCDNINNAISPNY